MIRRLLFVVLYVPKALVVVLGLFPAAILVWIAVEKDITLDKYLRPIIRWPLKDAL